MRHIKLALTLVLYFGLTLATPTFADEVKLTPEDYALLIGKWEGTYESRNTDGKVVYTLDVRLDVVEDKLGKFWISKNNREWGTTVQIVDGKVVLRFGRAERPFVYAQQEGATTLSVDYDAEFEGQPRKDSLVLTKKTNTSP